jgi:hypothetical protein
VYPIAQVQASHENREDWQKIQVFDTPCIGGSASRESGKLILMLVLDPTFRYVGTVLAARGFGSSTGTPVVPNVF